jgi:tetratricopeptide (TPR) repeat protein
LRVNLHRVLVCVVCVVVLTSSGLGQAPNVDSMLDRCFHSMYNLQFGDAFLIANQAKAADKNDPMPWVAQAAGLLFRELDRLHVLRSDLFVSDTAFSNRPAYNWDPASKKDFEDALASAEKLAKDRLDHDKNDIRGLFSLALVNGLRANDAALITKHNLTSLGFTKTSSGFAEKLLALSPNYYDAYIATGMSQYLIGSKAAPVRWILRLGGFKGDQEEGVKELSMVADHGRYLAPFAQILLAFNDLRHQNRTEARRKFAALHDQFPANPLYQQEMAKCDRPSLPPGQ